MVLDIDGYARTRLPDQLHWLRRLQAAWENQRADAWLPAADELFLADLADLVPRLVLAHREEETGGFRIEFAGVAARALLELEPVGEIPEHGPLEHPLAWLGAGFVGVRRPAVPGPRWLRRDDRVGVFLPYGAFDRRVTLILVGIARWPDVDGGGTGGGEVVPLQPAGGRPGRRSGGAMAPGGGIAYIRGSEG